uniref:Uncharacterized protein n=1 Tax=Arundo donax TaxID=35708 RepID=A0A0A9FEG1_ARUDO
MHIRLPFKDSICIPQFVHKSCQKSTELWKEISLERTKVQENPGSTITCLGNL